MRRIVAGLGITVQRYALDKLPAYTGKLRSKALDNVAAALEYDIRKNKLPNRTAYPQTEIDNWLRTRTWGERSGAVSAFGAAIQAVFSQSVSVGFAATTTATGGIGIALPLSRPSDDSQLLEIERRQHAEEIERMNGRIQALETECDQAAALAWIAVVMCLLAERRQGVETEKRQGAESEIKKLRRELDAAKENIRRQNRRIAENEQMNNPRLKRLP